MNNRLKTDQLCATSSFTTGLGSVLNLRGQLYDYDASDNPDHFAILNAWSMAGKDIRDVLENSQWR